LPVRGSSGMLYIAVVGGSQCTDEEYNLAYAVGREAARHNAVLICGGGSGVMEAAAKGASENGGIALGILPGERNDQGNRYLSFTVATGMGEARNAIIARTADFMIAVGGEYGTLSEIALALKLDKPVIGLSSWRFTSPHPLGNSITVVETAIEAVEKGLTMIKSR
jgi:uncharacterized protein (TIGR00725 family)